MENRNSGIWLLLVVAAFVVGFALGAFTQALAQTPPVSTIQALPDTTCCTLDLTLVVDVSSSIPWEGELVGIYWTAPGLEGWNYAGATADTLTWEAPADNLTYQFASTVDDSEGNSEGYDFISETFTHVCTTCVPPEGECPPVSPLEALHILAASGFDMEADTPKIRWWWTHPTTGSPVDRYEIEWVVDTFSSFIDSIAVGDTTFAFWLAPTTPGQTQTVRVRGWDAIHLDTPGLWSEWGEPWTDQGPPGPPPTVGRDLQMVD